MNNKEYKSIVEQIRSRIEQHKSFGGGKFNKIYKVNEGKTQVRILPYPKQSHPFIELYFHYDIGGATILCPQHTIGIIENNPCPICEFAKAIFADKKDSDVTDADRALYRKLKAKLRIFVPIVERNNEFNPVGEPDVKFWGFGTGVYTALFELIDNSDYGIIWDEKAGHDIYITKKPKTKDRMFGEILIQAKPMKTALSDTDEQIKALVSSVPDILDIYKPLTSEEIGEKLDKWLEGKDQQPSDNVEEDEVFEESKNDVAKNSSNLQSEEDIDNFIDELKNVK